MVKRVAILFAVLLLNITLFAQCSICTKTAQQLGDGPARGMNSGIIYLAFIPLLVIGYVGFRWWKNEKIVTGKKD
ncbi:MAG: hypothetical protein QM594_14230 [Niabella sp.]